MISLLQELPDQQFDVRDIAAHLIDVVVLLRLLEVEPVDATRAHVLLAYYTYMRINTFLLLPFTMREFSVTIEGSNNLSCRQMCVAYAE